MRLLELTEGAPPRLLDLTPDEAAGLEAVGLAELSREPGSARWAVRAGRHVGVARVGEWQVITRPKVAIDRLIFMMQYALRPRFWRDTAVLVDTDADLVDMLAASFTHQARKAIEPGLLNGYIEVNEALPVLRGRIRVGDQISRHQRLSLPLEVTYQQFSADIAENQLLLSAALKLLRLPGVKNPVRQSLQRLRMQLAEVTPIMPGQTIPSWQPSRLNVRYQPALALAEVILAGDSFEQRHGDLQVRGFTFDMWKIYEDFVCVALRQALRSYEGAARLQHGLHLDVNRSVKMNPDFLWRGASGEVIVADAKYKAEKPAGFPNADLYQMLAYCTVLNIPAGHLIYAKGNEESASFEVAQAGTRIYCHTLDLAVEPKELLRQISQLAAQITREARETDHDRYSKKSISADNQRYGPMRASR